MEAINLKRWPRIKLDELQVAVIKSLQLDLSQVKIAKYFNVSQGNIGNIMRGKNWTHI